nr:S1 RNA-binding domain-containing protein [Pseudaminobacter sp.]
MPNKMLIDASHPEETRVVVVHGNRIEEFDFESQDKKQLKGNIYLARVTRVEPSLQAAFVEYGGNRHGFLAFSEIHPDYYQIPVADRQALLRAEAEAAEEENDEDGDGDDRRGRRRRRGGKNRGRNGDDAHRSAGASGDNLPSDENGDHDHDGDEPAADTVDEHADAGSDDESRPAISAAFDADVISEPADESPVPDNDRGVLEDISAANGDEHEIESV